ncbi:ABC transporter permease [Streptomyces sp. 8N616]|uniref:ABC transporter permease n=1 Tax=Streptomyces sp. 8N616 TaxID=3457414 RepID=UPI003FD5CE57
MADAGGERVLVTGLRAYGLIVAMWIRSTLAYRASFAMTAFGNLAATGLDFVAILLMFSHVTTLGGFTLPEVAFLYGTSGTAFGLADLVMGSMDRLGRRVRDGTLDTLLVRPAPVLAQVAADRFALRRLGRVTQGLLVLVWSLAQLEVAWTPVKVLMLPLMVVSGAAIFSAVFVAGAAFQFWAQDASEVQNSFTYGGSTLLQYPPTVFGHDLVRGVTFVVPCRLRRAWRGAAASASPGGPPLPPAGAAVGAWVGGAAGVSPRAANARDVDRQPLGVRSPPCGDTPTSPPPRRPRPTR